MTSALLETNTIESAPNMGTLLEDTATAHGVSLEPDRLAYLTKTAEHMQSQSQLPDTLVTFWDRDDIEVCYTSFSERFNATAARIHFNPVAPGEEDMGIGAMSARPEHATLFTLMAIHGLQNYVLLAEAGAIEKPDILFGSTNPQMAIAAERVGLVSDVARQHPNDPDVAHSEMRKQSKLEVYGSFDEVRTRVFSEDTQKLERILSRRLAAQEQVGTVALNA